MSESADERFDSLYRRYATPVMRYFLRRSFTSDEAADATADVFLVLWRRLAAMPAGDREEPWVYKTCQNVMRNHRRSLTRRRRLERKVYAQRAVPDIPVGNPGTDGVLEAIERLRPSDREVIRLAAWEDLDHATIGRILGCSTHAVDQRLHRAMGRLRNELLMEAET